LRFWGLYKLVVGILACIESLLGIIRSGSGPAMNPWGPVTVGAAVLLAIEGIAELFPQLHRWLLVSMAVVVPLGISISSVEWPLKAWMFAASTGFVEWMFLRLKIVTGRMETGSLACVMALALSLANTTVLLFRVYWSAPEFWPLGQIFRFMLPIALPWTLILILLGHAAREGAMASEADAESEIRPELGPRSAI
jgi:hypothetical protein